jgi:uncharacterized protein involved in exopolysaccharide biosynthesis
MNQASTQHLREAAVELPMDSPEPDGEPNGEFQASRKPLTEWLDMLWGERRLLFRVTAIGFVAAILTAFLIPKRYTTTTRLMPPDAQSASSMMMLAGLAQRAGNGLGAVAGDLLGMKSSGALFVGVLQSETVENRLIQQFDLKKVYGTRYQQEARKKLGENTSIQEERKSGIITIGVTDRSPARAADLANAYVEELNSTVSQLSTSSARRERVFLEERLRTVKQDLDDADMQLAQFSSKNNTLDIQQQGKAMLEAAGTLAGQMIAAESELEGLRQIYSENNARIRALNARVGELRKELSKLSGKNGDAGNATAAADSSSGMPYPSLRKLPLLGAEYADYYRRAKIQETIYELLTEQYELAKVEEAKETPSIKVLDPAEIPEKKSYPPRSLIIVSGTLAAAALCTLWIFGSKRWQGTNVRDPRRVFAQKVFATLKSRIPERVWRQDWRRGLYRSNGE